jgi:Golgi nucleoside diphosphatase
VPDGSSAAKDPMASARSASQTSRFSLSLSLSQRNRESHMCLCRSFSIYGLQGASRKS